MNKNLWPAFEAKNIKSPKSFLVEQANYLCEATSNVLLAEIRSRGAADSKILHSFDIVAPALNNYRFNLFHIRHDFINYPLDFIYGEKIKKIKSEAELALTMKEVFNSDSTKNIINSLYSQSV